MDNDFLFKFLKKNPTFFPSKKLGQNFLIDNNYKKKIVESANLEKEEIVFEIGPGFGSLTDYILSYTKNLYLIEYDKRINEVLTHNYKSLTIFNDDALKFDFAKETKNFEKITIVSNLPYSISSKIMFKLIEIDKIKKMVLMFQKEFADKLLDKKKLNKLNIFVNYFFNYKKICIVPKNSFFPKPKIDSEVILFNRKHISNDNFDYKNFSKFINTCFLFPRKKMFSNLLTNYNKEKILSVFSLLKIDLNERVENLSFENFINIYLEFIKK